MYAVSYTNRDAHALLMRVAELLECPMTAVLETPLYAISDRLEDTAEEKDFRLAEKSATLLREVERSSPEVAAFRRLLTGVRLRTWHVSMTELTTVVDLNDPNPGGVGELVKTRFVMPPSHNFRSVRTGANVVSRERWDGRVLAVLDESSPALNGHSCVLMFADRFVRVRWDAMRAAEGVTILTRQSETFMAHPPNAVEVRDWHWRNGHLPVTVNGQPMTVADDEEPGADMPAGVVFHSNTP